MAACTRPAYTYAGSLPAGVRYGGGSGYPDMIFSSDPCVSAVVSDKPGLIAALGSSSSGQAVFVANSAVIDLTGITITVPAGVTLASGRGQGGSPGGVLFQSNKNLAAGMIQVGAGARITGLRIRGHDGSKCDLGCTTANYSRGIVTSAANVEIDNNQIYQWTYGGVALSGGASNTFLHHNFFNHNQMSNAGYATALDSSPSNATIEWNRYNANRHAVAGNGNSGQSYTAHHNLVLDLANGHIFDMHGVGTPLVAGSRIEIFKNVVLHNDYSSVRVRGKPDVYAWIYDNCFAHLKVDSSKGATKKDAVWQEPTNPGNFSVGSDPHTTPWTVVGNTYGATASQCGVSGDL